MLGDVFISDQRLEDLFTHRKPVKALITILQSGGETYGSEVSDQINTTYAHTVKILNKFEKQGLVDRNQKGRKKVLTLTDEGKELAEIFEDLFETLDKIDGEQE